MVTNDTSTRDENLASLRDALDMVKFSKGFAKRSTPETFTHMDCIPAGMRVPMFILASLQDAL